MPFGLKFWPTVMTLPALIVLIALGSWQLDRLEWKQDLIDKLQTRATAEPTPLPPGPLDIEDWEFARVTVTGVFDHDNELYWVQRSRQGEPGFHVVTPLTRTDAQGAGQTVLIARGYVPFEDRGPENRPESLVPGEQTITGILRFDRGPALFTPDNDPAANTWFTLDAQVIGNRIGADDLPVHFVMAETPSPGEFPAPRQWTLDVRNNHLEYAITWFSLAAGLVLVYVAFHVSQARERRGS